MKLFLTHTQQENFKRLVGYYGNSVDDTLRNMPSLNVLFTDRQSIEDFFDAITTEQDFMSDELIHYIQEMNITSSHALMVFIAKKLGLIRKPIVITDARRNKLHIEITKLKNKHNENIITF